MLELYKAQKPSHFENIIELDNFSMKIKITGVFQSNAVNEAAIEKSLSKENIITGLWIEPKKVSKKKGEAIIVDNLPQDVKEILAREVPKSAKMKPLVEKGLSIGEVAKLLSTNYSYVYNYVNGKYER